MQISKWQPVHDIIIKTPHPGHTEWTHPHTRLVYRVQTKHPPGFTMSGAAPKGLFFFLKCMGGPGKHTQSICVIGFGREAQFLATFWGRTI